MALLVPEQYTLQAERDLMGDLALPGFFRLEVLSAFALQYRVFEHYGADERVLYRWRGRAVTWRAPCSGQQAASFYSGALERPGFIKRMGDLLATVRRWGWRINCWPRRRRRREGLGQTGRCRAYSVRLRGLMAVALPTSRIFTAKCWSAWAGRHVPRQPGVCVWL